MLTYYDKLIKDEFSISSVISEEPACHYRSSVNQVWMQFINPFHCSLRIQDGSKISLIMEVESRYVKEQEVRG